MMIGRSLAPAVLFLFCLAASPILGQEARGPKMILNEELFDFGEVKEGAIIEHAFPVLNQGSEVLEIRDVKPG